MNPQHAVKRALSGRETDHPEAGKKKKSIGKTERERRRERNQPDAAKLIGRVFPVRSDPKYTAAVEFFIYGASVTV